VGPLLAMTAQRYPSGSDPISYVSLSAARRASTRPVGGSPSGALEIVGVDEVLRATRRAFLSDQVGFADASDRHVRDDESRAGLECRVEIAAGNLLHQVDARGGMPHPNHVEPLRLVQRTQRAGRCAERFEAALGTLEVVVAVAEPQVSVFRESRHTVERHRLSSDQQVFNLLVCERRKQIDQVGGEVHRDSRFATIAAPFARQLRGAEPQSPGAKRRGRDRRWPLPAPSLGSTPFDAERLCLRESPRQDSIGRIRRSFRAVDAPLADPDPGDEPSSAAPIDVTAKEGTVGGYVGPADTLDGTAFDLYEVVVTQNGTLSVTLGEVSTGNMYLLVARKPTGDTLGNSDTIAGDGNWYASAGRQLEVPIAVSPGHYLIKVYNGNATYKLTTSFKST
jgi:hypothetical protein